MAFERSANGRWTWLYKYPVFGTVAQAKDSMEDARKRERDFLRNTGRYYAYESDSYVARTAPMVRGAIREVAGSARKVGHTVSNIMELD